MLAEVSAADRESSVNAAALLTGVCLVPVMLSPYVAAAAARDLSFDSQQIGTLITAMLSGVIVVMVSAAFWVRRVGWRPVITFGCALAAVGFASAGCVRSLAPMSLLMALASIGCGIAYAPVICALGDTHDPDRSFGRSFFFQIIIGGAAGLAATELGPRWGVQAVMALLSVIFAGAIALVRFIPTHARERSAPAASEFGSTPARLYAGLAGILFLTIGPTTTWVFFDRIGEGNGLSARAVGYCVAAGLLFGAPGALLAAPVGRRVGRALPMLAATALMVADLALTVTTRSLPIYALCAVAFQFLWNFSLAFQYAALADCDRSGRLIVLGPVAQGIGAVLAPAMAGALVSDSNYWAAVGLALLSSMAGAALMLLLLRTPAPAIRDELLHE